MSSKGKVGLREAEIEKCREESNWKKVLDLSEDMKKRVPSSEPLANFLIAESRLELFIAEHGLSDERHEFARVELSSVKYLLKNAATADASHKEMGIDANLLLAKLHFASGTFADALECLNKAGLDSLYRRQLPTRSLRIVAESFAVKGLCLERVSPASSSKFRVQEHQESVINTYEQASDLALLYVQELDKSGGFPSTWSVHTAGSSSSPLPPAVDSKLGFLLENALLRTTELLNQAHQLPRLVNRHRCVLSAAESSSTVSIRLSSAKQLAELLLFSISDRAYTTLQTLISNGDGRDVSSRSPLSPWKPRKQAGVNVFSPKEINEEIILLLLISEALAVREAVLTQTPETAAARERSCVMAESVYDLMTLTLLRKRQAIMVCESLERALRFSFERGHVWRQYMLCLSAAGEYRRALLVASEAVRLLTDSDTSIPLVAARICYQRLHRYDEGLDWSLRALRNCDNQKCQSPPLSSPLTLSSSFALSPSLMASRCHLYAGIGHMLQTGASQVRQDRQQRSADALHHFRKSCELGGHGDHLSEFYLAYQLCLNRKLTAAAGHIQTALKYRPDHQESIHLLVLLLTAQNKHDSALQLLEAALEEFPDSLQLMHVRAYLEEYCNGVEVALVVARAMLKQWRVQYDSNAQQPSPSSPNNSSRPTSNLSDADAGSVCAASTVAHSVIGESAMSEVDSSLKSGPLRCGPEQLYSVQLQLWLLIAQLFIKLDQVGDAVSCVQEAMSITPSSHLVEHMKGVIEEHRGDFKQAKRHYSDALSLNPGHVTSLQRLGLIHHYLGSHRLAEKVLREAIQLEPMLHEAWYNLGKVLEYLEEYEAASDCFLMAIDIEASAPLLPFTTVPICFE